MNSNEFHNHKGSFTEELTFFRNCVVENKLVIKCGNLLCFIYKLSWNPMNGEFL